VPALRRTGLLAILTACLAPCAGAGIAQAAGPAGQRFVVRASTVRTAQDIARVHWGTDPCSGDVQIRWSHMADQTINALSSWRSFGSAYANPAANRDCRIDFNTTAAFDWPKFCTVLVHEYGHLAGRPHADRAGHLMSPVYSSPLPECEGRATARRAPGSRRSAPRRRAG
jgi:hypothetical protein